MSDEVIYGYVYGDSLVAVDSAEHGKPVEFTTPPEVSKDKLRASYSDDGEKIVQSWCVVENYNVLKAAVALAKSSAVGLPRMQAIEFRALYDEWSGKGVAYKKGDWLRYGQDFAYVEQDHTSQEDWTPDAAPSLYTLFKLAPDGVRIWEEPTRAENAFDTGEKCHYPDADGAIYVSLIDGNTTVPGSDERYWDIEG